MTSYAPQLPGGAVQRDPVSAPRANGIRSERCPCDDCPLAGAGVRDFEAGVWEDHCAVAHHHERFLWTRAWDGGPPRPAGRAIFNGHPTGPPLCLGGVPGLALPPWAASP